MQLPEDKNTLRLAQFFNGIGVRTVDHYGRVRIYGPCDTLAELWRSLTDGSGDPPFANPVFGQTVLGGDNDAFEIITVPEVTLQGLLDRDVDGRVAEDARELVAAGASRICIASGDVMDASRWPPTKDERAFREWAEGLMGSNDTSFEIGYVYYTFDYDKVFLTENEAETRIKRALTVLAVAEIEAGYVPEDDDKGEAASAFAAIRRAMG